MPQAPPRQRGPVLYQIDFTAVAAGKRVPTSKRRVRWYVCFGFGLFSWNLRLGFVMMVLASSRSQQYRYQTLDLVWGYTRGHINRCMNPPLHAHAHTPTHTIFIFSIFFFTVPQQQQHDKTGVLDLPITRHYGPDKRVRPVGVRNMILPWYGV
jgi:hypothetical protein